MYLAILFVHTPVLWKFIIVTYLIRSNIFIFTIYQSHFNNKSEMVLQGQYDNFTYAFLNVPLGNLVPSSQFYRRNLWVKLYGNVYIQRNVHTSGLLSKSRSYNHIPNLVTLIVNNYWVPSHDQSLHLQHFYFNSILLFIIPKHSLRTAPYLHVFSFKFFF